MTIIATKSDTPSGARVNVLLTRERITSGFRDAIFDAADRENVSPSQFLLITAAKDLLRSGATFPGVFRSGDLAAINDNAAEARALNHG
jgi:hypothetical protein